MYFVYIWHFAKASILRTIAVRPGLFTITNSESHSFVLLNFLKVVLNLYYFKQATAYTTNMSPLIFSDTTVSEKNLPIPAIFSVFAQ